MRTAPVSSWKAEPCLPGLAQNICYQATGRPVPLENGVVYTPSGSISQQHCITLTGFLYLDRERFDQASVCNQPVSLSATQHFPTVSLLCSLRAALPPKHWNRAKECLWNKLSEQSLAKKLWDLLLHDLSAGGSGLNPRPSCLPM